MTVFSLSFLTCDGGNSFEEVFGEDEVSDEKGGSSSGTFVNISINATSIGLTSDVNNFPLLIRLDAANFPDIATKTESGGADIRFTKPDGTQLSYEIEDWVDGTSGVVWVLMDTVSSSSASTIRMYYNDASAISMSDGAAVFNVANNFQGVWHLGEDNAGDTGDADIYKDSTSNAYHGDDYVTSAGKEGDIGRGQEFDGNDDNIYLGTFDPSTADLTLSMWMKWNGDNGEHQALLAKRSPWGTTTMRWQLYREKNMKDVMFYTASNNAQFTEFPSVGVWTYVTLTYTGSTSTARLYFDVAQYGGDQTMTWDTGTNAEVRIGNTDSLINCFNGFIDEVRISSTPPLYRLDKTLLRDPEGRADRSYNSINRIK